MIHRILAAVDDSDHAPEVVAAAGEVAARFGASLHLFTALSIPPDIPAAAHNAPDDAEQRIADRALERLQGLAAAFPGAAVERPQITNAAPWRSILECARRLDVELIVIGSHGYGGWDRLLGTTAASVVNRADRHVWVVHSRSGGTVEE